MKDTVSALEDDAALYHLSHDAPHRPDVHWEQRTQTNINTHINTYTNTVNILTNDHITATT